jgi:hypothetical protein
MKKSDQDQYYLDVEGDSFFNRNTYDFDQLPEKKKEFIDYFIKDLIGEKIDNILEIGCHIGDLLDYSVTALNAKQGWGIEPSHQAIIEGNKRFSHQCNLIHGVIGNSALLDNVPKCELVIVNDVFCWISRETILQSITNIDSIITESGYLLIRDFLPDRRLRNRNHHITDAEIYCHKILGSHTAIFCQTGNYQIISSKVFTDNSSTLSKTKEYDSIENRWMDTLLQKKWID